MPDHSGAALTIQRVQPYEHRGIAVTSSALDADGKIDDRYSAYFDDQVPGLAWSAVIEAQAYVLIVEDPDAPMDQPFVHWLLWNIPGKATEIAPGLERTEYPKALEGAVQGLNSAGAVGWHGTKPPEGHGVHHYHFQLFALAEPLDLPPKTTLQELVDVLKGNAIASGEVVGLYKRKAADDVPLAGGPAHGAARDAELGRGGLDSDDADRHAPHGPDGAVKRRSA
jgi:Raf kinase inhibitor-like YbhB/YbcL family protein